MGFTDLIIAFHAGLDVVVAEYVITVVTGLGVGRTPLFGARRTGDGICGTDDIVAVTAFDSVVNADEFPTARTLL